MRSTLVTAVVVLLAYAPAYYLGKHGFGPWAEMGMFAICLFPALILTDRLTGRR